MDILIHHSLIFDGLLDLALLGSRLGRLGNSLLLGSVGVITTRVCWGSRSSVLVLLVDLVVLELETVGVDDAVDLARTNSGMREREPPSCGEDSVLREETYTFLAWEIPRTGASLAEEASKDSEHIMR